MASSMATLLLASAGLNPGCCLPTPPSFSVSMSENLCPSRVSQKRKPVVPFVVSSLSFVLLVADDLEVTAWVRTYSMIFVGLFLVPRKDIGLPVPIHLSSFPPIFSIISLTISSGDSLLNLLVMNVFSFSLTDFDVKSMAYIFFWFFTSSFLSPLRNPVNSRVSSLALLKEN